MSTLLLPLSVIALSAAALWWGQVKHERLRRTMNMARIPTPPTPPSSPQRPQEAPESPPEDEDEQ